MARIRAAVIGATGYTGAELVRILGDHPRMELTVLTSRQYAGKPFSAIYPAMRGNADTVLVEYDAKMIQEQADIAFTALPHKLPMRIVPELVEAGVKVVDLSADFRFSNISAYEKAYQVHTAKELSQKAVYGLSELYAEKIQQADLVGNPGCYPTCTLLPLLPVLKKGLIDPDTIVVDAKSGVSGAGRGISTTVHFCEVTESFRAYKVGSHRHIPEMEEVISAECAKEVSITFIPHLLPMSRGMLSVIYADLTEKTDYQNVLAVYEDSYGNKPFIRVLGENTFPDTRNVRGTNFCEIGFHVDTRNRRIILMGAIDNLVKGASGQAVQNANIMMGVEENLGLDRMPYAL